ncbi:MULTISPECIES: 5-deoxy-glucuronate isomerase [unclassified Streptomyces]|uniref:5-deoxy-glucuronate isomerase n=1 Tax=unclassified Streptomyces TaxID=2593676 RepID=UPI00278C7D4C|nr:MULTISPECIES: 5-deoxy-glucuronate isomerase [unclassified Streptomyces]
MSTHIDTAKYHLPKGTSATGEYELEVTPESAGWGHSGLKVLTLSPGEAHTFRTGDAEFLVLPLEGAVTVGVADETFELAGRSGVFAAATDFAYVPRASEVTVTSAAGGRFALPSARTERALPARYGRKEDVPVELRGAGACSRQVNNYCLPGTFEADQLLVCEVLTPGGNWSSYPPHKHDEARPGQESQLEEIYYFQLSGGADAFAYQRVYGTEDRPLDVLAEVRSGDTVLIPHGWHGPSIAAPGYDLYYLNVMAGPGQDRAWLICDDPAHGWVRTTWASQDVDDRLPFGGDTER